MSKGKLFGVSLLTYLLLNLVFMLAYGIFGTHIGFGLFFNSISGNINSLIISILAPGGIHGDVFTGTIVFITMIVSGTNYTGGILGLCWVIVPGLITALLAGYKLSASNGKHAYIAIFLTILIYTCIPLVFTAVWPVSATADLTMNVVPTMYYELSGLSAYFYPALVGFFNGLFFGGMAASASSL